MKNILLATLFVLLLSNGVKAQGYVQNMSGSPINEVSLKDISGSPYFNENFLKGSITLVNNAKYDNISLKYNELSDQIIYKTEGSEQLMEPNEKVKKFSMTSVEGKEITFLNLGKEKENKFYEVLSQGSTTLLKKNSKSLLETVAYNSAGTDKSIKSSVKYYILKNDNLSEIKRDKGSFLALFADQKDQMQSYITSEKISFKSDTDLAKLINHYNSLK